MKEKVIQNQNFHVLVIFRNKRAAMQVRTLARQSAVCDPKFLAAVYEEVTKKPYSYLCIDLRPEKDYSLVTNVFLEEPGEPIWTYI